MIYLIDSNILIEAKNRYYDFDIAPGFWEFLLRESKKGTLKSNDMVYLELTDQGGDRLKKWTEDNGDIFNIHSDEEEIQYHFSEIATYVEKHPRYSDSEKARFLSGADGWLIAAAKHYEGVVVTHEQAVNEHSSKVKIPNVANHFGVLTIDTFELMRRLGGRLELA